MKNIIFLALITLISLNSCTASIEKNEQKALKSLNKILSIADIDADYILNFLNEKQSNLTEEEQKAYNEKLNIIQAAYRKCGIIEEDHLNIPLLFNCMKPSADCNEDGTSSYCKLYAFLQNLVSSPFMCQYVPETRHPGFMISNSNLISENDWDKEFYQLMRAILEYGLLKEYDDYNDNLTIEQERELGLSNKRKPNELEIVRRNPYEKETKGAYNDAVFIKVENMPQFKGGEEALTKYLTQNNAGVKAKVEVQFVVDYKGKVTKAKIIKGFNPETDKKALEVIQSMPDWKPGNQRGRAVNVKLEDCVIFLRK